jgi:hypothetical protein
MLASILAATNSLIRTSVAIGRKALRHRNASSMWIFTTLIFAIPLWLISLLFFAHTYQFIFSTPYLLYVIARSVLVIIGNLWGIFFYKFQALSEYSIYGLMFWTLVGWLVDRFYFHTTFGVRTTMGIVLLFVAWILISSSKKSPPPEHKKPMKLWQILWCICLLSILGVVQTTLYKIGVNMQNPAVHGMFSQLITFSIVTVIGRKRLRKDIQNKSIWTKDIALQSWTVFIYTLIEPFVIKWLPIIIINLLWSLQLILYTLYDLRKKEFKKRWKVISALLLAIWALILINF